MSRNENSQGEGVMISFQAFFDHVEKQLSAQRATFFKRIDEFEQCMEMRKSKTSSSSSLIQRKNHSKKDQPIAMAASTKFHPFIFAPFASKKVLEEHVDLQHEVTEESLESSMDIPTVQVDKQEVLNMLPKIELNPTMDDVINVDLISVEQILEEHIQTVQNEVTWASLEFLGNQNEVKHVTSILPKFELNPIMNDPPFVILITSRRCYKSDYKQTEFLNQVTIAFHLRILKKQDCMDWPEFDDATQIFDPGGQCLFNEQRIHSENIDHLNQRP